MGEAELFIYLFAYLFIYLFLHLRIYFFNALGPLFRCDFLPLVLIHSVGRHQRSSRSVLSDCRADNQRVYFYFPSPLCFGSFRWNTRHEQQVCERAAHSLREVVRLLRHNNNIYIFLSYSMNGEISITAPAARCVWFHVLSRSSDACLKAWLPGSQSNNLLLNNVPRRQYQKGTMHRDTAPPALSLIWRGVAVGSAAAAQSVARRLAENDWIS